MRNTQMHCVEKTMNLNVKAGGTYINHYAWLG